VVIVGAGGHGRELLDLVEAVNATPGRGPRYRFLGFLDATGSGGTGGGTDPGSTAVSDLAETGTSADMGDDGAPDLDLLARRGANLLGGLEQLARLDADYLIGVRDAARRARLDGIASAAGRRPATLVHPSASVGGDVRLGPGTVVCALACLTTNVRTGRHVIVNVGASIGHDCQVGDYAALAPGARVGGGVSVGTGAWIGSAASVVGPRAVGSGAVVAAGSVVLADVPAGLVVAGSPARPVRDAAGRSTPAAYAIPGRRDGSARSAAPGPAESVRSSDGPVGEAGRM